ncbi:hypothetical protein [Nocardia thailandica]
MTVGRSAALPSLGYLVPPRRAAEAGGHLVVIVRPELGGRAARFDFAVLPVSALLREWLAQAFACATGPSGTSRTVASAQSLWRAVRSWSAYLSTSAVVGQPRQLRAHHWQEWVVSVPIASRKTVVGSLRSVLRCAREVPDDFRSQMQRSLRSGRQPEKLPSYSAAEFARITTAAKSDLRRCVRRIRAGRAILAAWRAGELDPDRDRQRWQLGWLLDHIDRHDRVPRYRAGRQHNWVSDHGGSPALFGHLYPTHHDLAAAAVAMICLTGHNLSAVLSLTDQAHRPDGDAGGPRTALVEMIKLRRGRARAHMSVALSETGRPASGRIDVASPFGVYQLVREIGAPVRHRLGTDQLFCYYVPKKGQRFRPGLRVPAVGEWGRRCAALAEDGGVLDVDTRRLRMSWLQLHQRPVAQTEQTLANDYLARDRGDLAGYQRVVAEALAEQVTAARAYALMPVLTEDQTTRARADAADVAPEVGLAPGVLADLVEGRLDTVLAGCTDFFGGPHAAPGQACTASFLLCLSCPCARATPAHLPVIAATHDLLRERAQEMTPLRWAQRFAAPVTQLADILDRFPEPVVEHARAAITAEQHDLVLRLLNRSLDLR